MLKYQTKALVLNRTKRGKVVILDIITDALGILSIPTFNIKMQFKKHCILENIFTEWILDLEKVKSKYIVMDCKLSEVYDNLQNSYKFQVIWNNFYVNFLRILKNYTDSYDKRLLFALFKKLLVNSQLQKLDHIALNFLYFFYYFAYIIGIRIEIYNSCSKCSLKFKDYMFDVATGKIFCQNCVDEGIRVSGALVRLMISFRNTRYRDIHKLDFKRYSLEKEMQDVFNAYFEYHLNIRPVKLF